MTPHKVTSTWWDHATLWSADDPTLQDAGHTTDGGRVFGITRVRYDECDHYGCTPVAVIDPESTGDIERLFGLLGAKVGMASLSLALYEFASPTPPRPDEPLGLGAVVEDEDGCWWVRFSAKTGSWWRNHQGENRRYVDIAAVRVLSEGVVQS